MLGELDLLATERGERNIGDFVAGLRRSVSTRRRDWTALSERSNDPQLD